jgi:hypothetical protein
VGERGDGGAGFGVGELERLGFGGEEFGVAALDDGLEVVALGVGAIMTQDGLVDGEGDGLVDGVVDTLVDWVRDALVDGAANALVGTDVNRIIDT